MDADVPQLPQRLVGGHGFPQPFKLTCDEPAEGLDDQLIHRLEVVVDETLFDTHAIRKPPGGERGVAFLAKNVLRSIEHRVPVGRARRPHAAGRSLFPSFGPGCESLHHFLGAPAAYANMVTSTTVGTSM